MQFITRTGSRYILEEDVLVRLSESPIFNCRTGENEKIIIPGDTISFEKPPTIGERFEYEHPVLNACSTSPVLEIID